MPIHHNKDGTWQWGQAGKKYRSRKDAIRQMRAIFANGYKEQQDKKASFLGASRASLFLAAVASVGSSYGMVKEAAGLQVIPVRHTIQKGDKVTGSIWNAYGKKHGYKNPILFQKAVQLANKGVNFNRLGIGKSLNIPKFTGTRLPLYYPIKWTALQNRAVANSARAKFFKDKIFNVADYTTGNYLKKKLLPQDKDLFSTLLRYPIAKQDPTGYLKIPQMVLRNAIKLKLTSGNRFAYNLTAAGPWQLLPGAVNDMRKNRILPMNFGLRSIYGNTDIAGDAGWRYYNHINKDNPLPWVGYAKYMMGAHHYDNLRKRPDFDTKKYPDARHFYWKYKNLYLKGDKKKLDYGARVRKFHNIYMDLWKRAWDTYRSQR